MNNKINIFLPFFCLIFFCTCLQAQENNLPKGVSCLGNGEMLVYEERCDIIQLFGPPYSSPSVLQLLLNSNVSVSSQREFGTAIWTHHLQSATTKDAGKIVDFVASDIPCFIRTIENTDSLRFQLKIAKETKFIDNTSVYLPVGMSNSLLLYSPAGTYVYSSYPALTNNYYQWMLTGDIRMSRVDDLTWDIVCLPGQSALWVVSGRDYPQFVTNTQQALEIGISELLRQTRDSWHRFTSRRIDFEKKFSAHVPQRERLLQAIDDVAVLIKVQQASEGSSMAGYNYHLGYVRDQYGVSRCLLKLGYIDEARAIMQFYWDIWQRKGRIHNAQGIGLDCFHVHENDEVEITGFLIVQAFDYMKATGDEDFIKTIFPMLEWAYDVQARNLHHGMLPFNGDETYIAGGILPRTAMFDGSAEATLLFLVGGKELVDWAAREKKWNSKKIDEVKKTLQEVQNRYAANFLVDGRLLTNNPARKKGLEFPVFRHGVCEACVCTKWPVGWTQRTPNNRYLCPVCFPYETLPDLKDEKFYIQSVSLTLMYIQNSVIPFSQLEKFVQEIIASYNATGKLPSRPDGNVTVGYDYGLFLYSLVKINHPLKDSVYARMFDVIDDAGAWVEYYVDDVPSGTLCRPWESGINLEAAIEFADSFL